MLRSRKEGTLFLKTLIEIRFSIEKLSFVKKLIMFFIIAKILDYTLSPLLWSIILLILAWVTKNEKYKRISRIVAFSILLIFSNTWIYNSVLNAWTMDILPKNKVTKAKVGVVMGGMSIYDPKNERVHFNQNIDRLLQAIPLLKNGTLEEIIVSGGSGYLRYDEFSEAKIILDYLIEIGVDTTAITGEFTSRTTYENALNTVEILKQKYSLEELQNNVIVITSAIHMRRSVACFQKLGLQVAHYSTNPASEREKQYHWEEYIVPNAHHFGAWGNLLHEIVGYSVYYIKGYI